MNETSHPEAADTTSPDTQSEGSSANAATLPLNAGLFASRTNSPRQEYHWYMGGQAMFFASGGIGFVLSQWLIAFYLREPPEVLGLAQMVMNLPQLLFLLFGGMAADRLELRSHLIRMQFFMMVPMLAVGFVIMGGGLTTPVLVAISFVAGTFGAFVQPARDSLLTKVTQDIEDFSIQQAITTANMLQFGAQIFGILLVMFVAIIGPVSLIFMQGFLYLMGIYATTRLSPAPPAPREKREEHPFHVLFLDVYDGLKVAFQSDQIRPIMLWVLSSGFITMGIFMVYLPLIVRDVFQGDAQELTIMMTCFFSGVTISSRLLSRIGRFKYQGRALLIGQTISACILMAISRNENIIIYFALIFSWGMTAAVSMSMTRSIIQQAAPDSHRARILSAFSLFMFGGSPVGALIGGYLAKTFGPLDAMLIAVAASLTLILTFTVFSGLWQLKAEYPTFGDEGKA